MITITDLAHGLDKVRWNGNSKFTACCPAHDDRNPSLAVSEIDGKILVHCFSGCCQGEVIDALRHRGLWPERSENRNRVRVSQDVIRRHQILIACELSRAEQGIPQSAEDLATLEKSVRFLRECGYE